MNPVADSQGLRLNVSEADNAQDIDLAFRGAILPHHGERVKDANAIIDRNQEIVRQWPRIAKSLRIPAREQQRMASAFRLAE